MGVALVALLASLSLLSPKTSAYAATSEDRPVSQGLSIKDLGTLRGGGYSWGAQINELGQVVGTSEAASGTEHAFLWQNGKMRDLVFRHEGFGSYDEPFAVSG
jgi:probable HAF family extracellular repeat protein